MDISTDTSCSYVDSTGISAGLLGDIETGRYDTTTSLCAADGEIGSLVLVPPDGAEKDAPFAFKVVGSLGGSVETNCIAPDYGAGMHRCSPDHEVCPAATVYRSGTPRSSVRGSCLS